MLRLNQHTTIRHRGENKARRNARTTQPPPPPPHLHGGDLARDGEVHELVADLHRQPPHQGRVNLCLKDDGLVSAHLQMQKGQGRIRQQKPKKLFKHRKEEKKKGGQKPTNVHFPLDKKNKRLPGRGRSGEPPSFSSAAALTTFLTPKHKRVVGQTSDGHRWNAHDNT